MTTMRAILGSLVAVVAVGAFAAVQASASSAPIVISYTKTCAGGTCVGTTGDGDTLRMQVTSLRATGKAAQLTATEWITGGISITAELSGHAQPGRVHRAERHRHGGPVRGRRDPPAEQPHGRSREHDVVER